MKARRSKSMTAVGVINIVAGAIACILALMLMFIGGPIAMASAMLLSGVGFVVLLVALLPLCFGVLFTISGIGVLKMEPWGRNVSILSGSVLAALCVEELVEQGPSLLLVACFSYGCALVFLCYTPQWRMRYGMRPARLA